MTELGTESKNSVKLKTIYYGKIYNYRRRQKTYNGFI